MFRDLAKGLEGVALGLMSAIHVAICRVLWPCKRPLLAGTVDSNPWPLLVIRCEAKLGDNLLNIPFLRALRARYPERSIHLLHHAAARSVYAHCPYIDKRIEIDWHMSAPSTLISRLARSRAIFQEQGRAPYSVAIIPRWDEDLYAPYLAWFSGARRRIGFSRRVLPGKATRNVGADLLLTDAICDRTAQHESRRALQLLDVLAPTSRVDDVALEYWFTVDDRQRVDALVPALNEEPGAVWIAMAPGAALDRRKWPRERFAQVATAILRRPDIRIAVLGSEAEAEDCSFVTEATNGGDRIINLCGHLNLPQCGALLSQCRVFVGNDSGLMHLACAFGIAVVEVSCHPSGAPDNHANSPVRFGPATGRSVVLSPAQPLDDACQWGCAFDTAHCITQISEELAIDATLSLLNAPQGRSCIIEHH